MAEATLLKRPPTRLYEVRTVHGEAYRAEGDVIESGGGWFTLWADQFTLALRVPEADIRAVRQVSEDVREAELDAQVGDDGLAIELAASQSLIKQQEAVIERVRNLSTEPEVMNANQPHQGVWLDGYRYGVLAAKSATRPRDEKASRS